MTAFPDTPHDLPVPPRAAALIAMARRAAPGRDLALALLAAGFGGERAAWVRGPLCIVGGNPDHLPAWLPAAVTQARVARAAAELAAGLPRTDWVPAEEIVAVMMPASAHLDGERAALYLWALTTMLDRRDPGLAEEIRRTSDGRRATGAEVADPTTPAGRLFRDLAGGLREQATAAGRQALALDLRSAGAGGP